jgi:hypothetical protein
MAQQDLNRSKVRAGVEHVGGAGVPKKVRVNATADPGAVARLPAQCANRGVIQRKVLLLGRKQPVGGARPSEVNTETFEQHGRQWNFTRDAPLASLTKITMRLLSMSPTFKFRSSLQRNAVA